MMTGEKYISTLDQSLMKDLHECEARTFVDDSAPCHRSKIVKNWSQNNKIETLDCPGNSPDLNPIENLWAILKRRLKMKPIRSQSELIKVAKLEWKTIPQNILQNLVHSMPRRIKEVIDCKGGPSKY